MGLDNGIILKLEENKVPEDFPGKLDKWELAEVELEKQLTIAYWRKCWDIRGIILGVLHAGDEGGEYSIEAEDLPAIRRGIVKLLNPKEYEASGDSIWEYEERIDGELENLLNMMWLERYLKKHPESQAYFYDSY